MISIILPIVITSLLLIWLLIILVLTIKNNDYYFRYEGATIVASILFIFYLIITVSSIYNYSLIDRKFEEIKYNYKIKKEVLDYSRGENISSYERISLTKDLLEINNIIAKHKAYYGNKWNGVFYSEEIGNLEPLK